MKSDLNTTAIQWLLNELSEKFPDEIKEMYQNNQLQFENIISRAKQMEETQKGYDIEQMLECWNTALKFQPHGPGFIEFINLINQKKNGNER